MIKLYTDPTYGNYEKARFSSYYQHDPISRIYLRFRDDCDHSLLKDFCEGENDLSSNALNKLYKYHNLVV